MTVRGKQAVAIIDAAELERLLPARPRGRPARSIPGEPPHRRLGLGARARPWPGTLALIGWLVDTNVIASLIAPAGAPSVKGWARMVDERRLFLSILTLAEYDKGIANLPDDDPNVERYSTARDALEDRFAGRTLALATPPFAVGEPS